MKPLIRNYENNGSTLCLVMKDDFLREILADVLSRLPHVEHVLECSSFQELQHLPYNSQCCDILIELSQAALCKQDCQHMRNRRPGTRIMVLAEPEECSATNADQLGVDMIVPFAGLLQAIEDLHALDCNRTHLFF